MSLTRLATVAAALALAACQQQSSGNLPHPDNMAARSAPAEPPSNPSATAPQPRPAESRAAPPDLSPPPMTHEAERSIAGARNLLLSFARAIELKRFDQAYALLSLGDRQRWSRADFAGIFKDLGKITVAVPTGTTDGAAGSIYYNAPVTITSTDEDGRPVRIEGEAVLRRVNDVSGATPAQLRWHFDHVTFDWTH